MTVTTKAGNLFSDTVECLVNPVNCVGVMGAGLAKQFASRWPAMLAEYQSACRNGECRIGSVHMWQTPDGRWIANLPTKNHWRDPSQLSYIDAGLTDLAGKCAQFSLEAVAMPALGCGLGGLPWPPVRDLIQQHFGNAAVTVHVFAPTTSDQNSRGSDTHA